jgi:hypothetical protein
MNREQTGGTSRLRSSVAPAGQRLGGGHLAGRANEKAPASLAGAQAGLDIAVERLDARPSPAAGQWKTGRQRGPTPRVLAGGR